MIKCPNCGRLFFSKRRFQTINNNGENLFICPSCSKNFNKIEEFEVTDEKKIADKEDSKKNQDQLEFIKNELINKGAWDVVNKFSEKYAGSSIVDYYWAVGLDIRDKEIVEHSDEIKETIDDVLSNVIDIDPSSPIFQYETSSDIVKLKELLLIKYKIEISYDDLKEVINYCHKETKKKAMDNEIKNLNEYFSEELNTKEQYVDALLKRYGEEYKNKLELLYEILKQKGINFISYGSLIDYFDERKKIMELEKFEKSLFL